jgi:bifunctional ADP-heptose synthase (sugar kinase/adenylyltransferase)
LGNPLVAVIGDSCIDVFVYCQANRLAPDLPIPVLERVQESTNPGMAMNVGRNLESIGLTVDMFTNENWTEISKTRFVDKRSNHSFFRLDSTSKIEPLQAVPDLSKFDAVVVSDYDKGYLSHEIITEILSSHDLCFLDTKKILGQWASNAHLIKINDYEFQRSTSFIASAPETASKIVRTLGGEGAEFRGEIFPAQKVEVLDSSGAGDAFMAALVGGILRGDSIGAAIHHANAQASKVVQSRGVTVIHA